VVRANGMLVANRSIDTLLRNPVWRLLRRPFLPLRRPYLRLIGSIERTLPESAQMVMYLKEFATYRTIKRTVRSRNIRWSSLELLFIHIPKTGGTSVQKILGAHGGIRVTSLRDILWLVENLPSSEVQIVTLSHLEPAVLFDLGLIEPQDVGKFDVFTVVRHPYDRIRSAYLHHQRPKEPQARWAQKVRFESYVARVSRSTFRMYYRNGFGLSHASPAAQWFENLPLEFTPRVFKLEEPEKLEAYLGDFFGEKITLERHNQRRSLQSNTPPGDAGQEMLRFSSPVRHAFHNRFKTDFALGSYERVTPSENCSG
jgi:hypothetical protein